MLMKVKPNDLLFSVETMTLRKMNLSISLM